MGDLNDQRQEFEKLMQPLGIMPAIPDGTVTHLAGGHLDQVLANVELTVDMLPIVEGTDHTGLVVKMTFQKKENDIDLKNMPKIIT